VAESLAEKFFAAFAAVFGLMARPAYGSVTIIDTVDQAVERAQTWADEAAVPTPTGTLSYIVGPCPNRPDKRRCL
jgi:hypothetical protein